MVWYKPFPQALMVLVGQTLTVVGRPEILIYEHLFRQRKDEEDYEFSTSGIAEKRD